MGNYLINLNIKKTNKIIGSLSITLGISYIIYSIYLYRNFEFYHLDPNILYFSPPHQLTFFTVVWLYSLMSIIVGIMILKEIKICYHLFNIIFFGLFFLNVKRLVGSGFSDSLIRTIGNIIFSGIAITGFYYFAREDVRKLFGGLKRFSIRRYILYIFLVFITYMIPHLL